MPGAVVNHAVLFVAAHDPAHGDRLQRRNLLDRTQGRDLADRHPRRPERRRRHRIRRDAAGDLKDVRVFDLTLTFDNGPEPAVTPRVLDILRARGIRTTFFARNAPCRLVQLVSRGCPAGPAIVTLILVGSAARPSRGFAFIRAISPAPMHQ